MACVLAGLTVFFGYFAIAFIQLNSSGLPNVFAEDMKLLAITVSLFTPFLLAGVVIASVFAEDSGRIHRLYFADLLGAGIACSLVVHGTLTRRPASSTERPRLHRRRPAARAPSSPRQPRPRRAGRAGTAGGVAKRTCCPSPSPTS